MDQDASNGGWLGFDIDVVVCVVVAVQGTTTTARPTTAATDRTTTAAAATASIVDIVVVGMKNGGYDSHLIRWRQAQKGIERGTGPLFQRRLGLIDVDFPFLRKKRGEQKRMVESHIANTDKKRQ